MPSSFNSQVLVIIGRHRHSSCVRQPQEGTDGSHHTVTLVGVPACVIGAHLKKSTCTKTLTDLKEPYIKQSPYTGTGHNILVGISSTHLVKWIQVSMTFLQEGTYTLFTPDVVPTSHCLLNSYPSSNALFLPIEKHWIWVLARLNLAWHLQKLDLSIGNTQLQEIRAFKDHPPTQWAF